MRGIAHTFYDENLLIDLRYLVAAETWEYPEEETMPESPLVYGIGAVLEIGGTAQRFSATYPMQADRDTAFSRLLALHQTFEAHVHTQLEDDE